MAFNGGANIQEDNCMYFYGSKSIEILDLKIDINVLNHITTISFHYIDYDDYLSKNFSRIKHKFPNVVVSSNFFCVICLKYFFKIKIIF